MTEVVDASLRELAPLFRRRHLAATFTERPLRATASAELIRRLRPGMEGVGKIDIDERKLVWIWTHSFTDWVRLWLWSWMP